MITEFSSLFERGKTDYNQWILFFPTASHRFTIFFIILILVAPIMNGLSAIAVSPGIEIRRTSSFIDEDGIMHVYGEVRNLSTKPMKNVLINVSFFDNKGNLLNKFNGSAELSTINPGGFSPFEILYIDSHTVNQVRDFKISTEVSPSQSESRLKLAELKITPTNSRLDIFGFYYINGRVTNNGKYDSTNTLIIATLYDKNGNVIAIGRGLAEPLNITAGSNSAFGLAVTEKLQTYKTVNYSLIADSDEFASVPVFTRASR